MSERLHQRVAYTVQVEFRTASSFLVAYSVNLSRGGLFVETDQEVPVGSPIELHLLVPGLGGLGAAPPGAGAAGHGGHGALDLAGVVAWRRPPDSPDGPPGLGIEFQDIAPRLGSLIDVLVAGFAGVSVLVLSGDRQGRNALARLVKSIIATAEVVQATDARVAETLLTPEIDLVIVDVDFDVEGALASVARARALQPRVPTVAMAATRKLRERAREAGADEVVANPPPFGDLQVMLVRALGKPVRVR